MIMLVTMTWPISMGVALSLLVTDIILLYASRGRATSSGQSTSSIAPTGIGACIGIFCWATTT